MISWYWKYGFLTWLFLCRLFRWRAAGEREKTSLRWTTRSWVEACATTTTRTSSTRLQGNATCTASSATCRTCWDTRWRSCMACWECSRTPRTEAAVGNLASRPDLREGLCLRRTAGSVDARFSLRFFGQLSIEHTLKHWIWSFDTVFTEPDHSCNNVDSPRDGRELIFQAHGWDCLSCDYHSGARDAFGAFLIDWFIENRIFRFESLLVAFLMEWLNIITNHSELCFNSFPASFHCYTLGGAITTSWMSLESVDQKHRRGRRRNERSHM